MSIFPSSYITLARERPTWEEFTPEKLDETANERISLLIRAIRERDILTFEHSRRVAIYARRLARALGYTHAEARRFALLGLIHDVGKMWMGDILKKTTALTPEEYNRIKDHAFIGYKLALGYDLPHFYADAIHHHHEMYDGNGYPERLSGEEIPSASRLIAVVDAFDVITSARPYKMAESLEEALVEIEDDAGKHFDPLLAATFITVAKRHPSFLVPPRICVVPWGEKSNAWYQIVTGF